MVGFGVLLANSGIRRFLIRRIDSLFVMPAVEHIRNKIRQGFGLAFQQIVVGLHLIPEFHNAVERAVPDLFAIAEFVGFTAVAQPQHDHNQHRCGKWISCVHLSECVFHVPECLTQNVVRLFNFRL